MGYDPQAAKGTKPFVTCDNTLLLAEGKCEREAMRFSAAAAALKCTRYGGILGAPTRAEVEAFIATQD